MTTSTELRKRRRTMASLVMQGVDPDQAAERLAGKFDVQKTTVRDDWYRRDQWLTNVFQWDVAQDEVEDILMQQKLVRKELWKMYRRANNENVKIGALNKIDQLNQRLLDMLQDVGEVERQPEKVDVRVADMKQRMREYYKEATGLDVQEEEES